MPTPISPKLIKGALVELSQRFISVVPNIIVFQYNPETMTRKLEPWNAPSKNSNSKSGKAPETAQPHDPPESFDLILELDAADALEKPLSHPVAFISGVADRIAALEMLMYPEVEGSAKGLLGSVAAGLGGAAVGSAFSATNSSLAGAALGAEGAVLGGFIEGGPNGLATTMPVPSGTVPTVLFIWGPGRMVPVRLTSFSAEEQAYSPTLYPIRAKVTVGLKIIAPRNLPCGKKPASELSIAAYNLYIRQKRGLAASNVANTIESAIGMLPI